MEKCLSAKKNKRSTMVNFSMKCFVFLNLTSHILFSLRGPPQGTAMIVMRGIIYAYARRGWLCKVRGRGWKVWEMPTVVVNSCADGCTRENFNHYSGWVKEHHGTQTGWGMLNQHFWGGERNCYYPYLFGFSSKLMFSELILHFFFINFISVMDDGYLLKGYSGMLLYFT